VVVPAQIRLFSLYRSVLSYSDRSGDQQKK
jgi:hypothetical protein